MADPDSPSSKAGLAEGEATPSILSSPRVDAVKPPVSPTPAEVLQLLKDSAPGEPPDYDAEIGSGDPNPEPDIDFTLHPSRDTPIAGELWSIAAEIYNRWTKPIWIVDSKTALSLAPEMYGLASQTGSMGAFFPTVRSRPGDEIVRIDPGGKYAVVWKIDPCSSKVRPGATFSLRQRIQHTLKSFTFFTPGKFRVSATIHVWSRAPKVSTGGQVTNVGDSNVMSESVDISMDASPWVLIFGAACGGVLAFLLQMLVGVISLGSTPGSILTGLLVGLGSAVLLSGVVTVLLSRLSTTDFLVVIRVKDFWGAVATGFVVQWLGYGALSGLLAGAQSASS